PSGNDLGDWVRKKGIVSSRKRGGVPIQTDVTQFFADAAQVPDTRAVLGANNQLRAVRREGRWPIQLVRVFQASQLATRRYLDQSINAIGHAHYGNRAI